jgi:hypothetical protein
MLLKVTQKKAKGLINTLSLFKFILTLLNLPEKQ